MTQNAPNFAPPLAEGRKETIASRVATQLRAEILSGALAPGDKLNLDRLRERLDISLAPVREAMTRLAADGLVEVEDQRGYRVAPISRANLDEVTRLRCELEPLALAQAITHATLDWEAAILSALHRLSRTPRTPNAEAWETAHTEFHLTLIGGCGMPLLIGFCTKLRLLNDRYRRLSFALAPESDIAGEHQAIAEAAVARDAPKACDLLARHITRTGTRLSDALAARLADPSRTARNGEPA
ncbi:HTH-type transcriptional regulator McbR [mine drainage metagenome]|uniref:HTH-type transcriptional regulator McbR n=1 Tax=mine drainage metagenome TaxID=410659 RepID=A0A1J5PQY3_9ZZZZ